MIIAILALNILVVSFIIIATLKISQIEDVASFFKYIPSLIGFSFMAYFYFKMQNTTSDLVFQYFIQTVLYFLSSIISIIIAFVKDLKKNK
ncbi:MAG: hypothetical protein ACQESN_00405 [Thermotogota bacterium]